MTDDGLKNVDVPLSEVLIRNRPRRNYMLLSLALVSAGFIGVFHIARVWVAFASFMILPIIPVIVEYIFRRSLWERLFWQCPHCDADNEMLFIDPGVKPGKSFKLKCAACGRLSRIVIT